MKKACYLLLYLIPVFVACQKDMTITEGKVTTVSVDEVGTNFVWLTLMIENRACKDAAGLKSGIAWSSSPSPTVSRTTEFSTVPCLDAGSLKVTGLATKTKYYFRAFAQFQTGEILYGNELTATTK